MARVYLKKSTKTASTGSDDVRAAVMEILNDIEAGGDAVALEYATKFDGNNVGGWFAIIICNNFLRDNGLVMHCTLCV